MKQRTRQPQSYMAMLQREGRWQILKSKLSKDIRMWHNCDDYGDEELVKHRTIYTVDYADFEAFEDGHDFNPTWRCSMCGTTAPEGLTGIYVMLDWDRATDEIANATTPTWKFTKLGKI